MGEKNIGKNRGTKMSENLYLDTRNYNIYLTRTLGKICLKAYVQTQEIIIYIMHSQPENFKFPRSIRFGYRLIVLKHIII